MRPLRFLLTGATTAATVLAPSAAAPAAADTTATITITSGSISLTVPTDAGSLGSRPNTIGGGTISGQLGQVRVEDARSAGPDAGWVITVESTAFAPVSGPSIPASAVGYTAGTITKVGTATYTANDPSDLSDAVAAVTATGISGDNTATWNPTISVAVPGSVAAGIYSATITHSIA